MYDVIVLGATFAAAGIAEQYKENCLVIERRLQGGYEFFCTDTDVPMYEIFKDCHTVFSAEVVSVEKTDKGFTCLTHGVDGFRTYEAKHMIDTLCREEMCLSKTYDLLMESPEAPAYPYCEKAKGENRYILRCPMPLNCTYPQARAVVKEIVERFSQNQRLIFTADAFTYQVKPGYPKVENTILLMPSKAYENPTLAYEAGLNLEVAK